MNIINISNARADIYRLIDTVNENHEPAFIKGKTSSAILIGVDDWRSIEETLNLSSIPGMVESLIDGMKTPIENCVDLKDLNF